MSDDMIFKLFVELSMLSMNCWLARTLNTLIPIII